MRHLIFVYGSLMKGFGNNKFLCDNSTFVETATIRGQLYSLRAFPALTMDTNKEMHTYTGELWLVNNDTLKSLDRLENHPHMYKRQFVVVEGDTGHFRYCQTYIWQRDTDGLELITSSGWAKHQEIMA